MKNVLDFPYVGLLGRAIDMATGALAACVLFGVTSAIWPILAFFALGVLNGLVDHALDAREARNG